MSLDVRLRPRLALPFAILADRDTVRLVAGEEFRYTLSAPGLDAWLPGWLARFDGSTTVEHLLAGLGEGMRGEAAALVERLLGERVLVPGRAVDAHQPAPRRLQPTGRGPLFEAVARIATGGGEGEGLAVLCQDRLDYNEALAFNAGRLAGGDAWMWATTGPMGRGFVSPVFLPDAGPCLACLVRGFERLSPAPEIYGHLVDHARRGGEIPAVPFAADGVEILAHLVAWKAALLAGEGAVAAFRLHVLEVADLEVRAHRVAADPECPECAR
jgi:bacteriocin biosynthesis cyclodehydratase domain-containing protein